jgi:hypothetical protein
VITVLFQYLVARFCDAISGFDDIESLIAAQSALENKPIMKNAIVTLGTVVALTAGLAHAQVAVEDTDGNGSYSMEELMVTYPDLTEDVFAEVDADGDGAVSADELTAAQDAQILVAN